MNRLLSGRNSTASAIAGWSKLGPPRARVELGAGAEQRGPAPGAAIGPVGVVVYVLAGERPLGVRLAQHRVLQRGQLLAPLLVRLGDLAADGCLGAGTRLTHGLIPFPLVHHAVRPAARPDDFLAAACVSWREAAAAVRRGRAPRPLVPLAGILVQRS